MNDVLVITGPTASGKTKLAYNIAHALKTEIIVADSMKVYKHADIATSKPPEAYRKKIPFHLIDIIEPCDRYDVGSFCRDTVRIINKLHKENRTPVIAGGTSLYITKLMEGIADIPQLPEDIKFKLEKQDTVSLYEQLKEADPERAAQLHSNMKKRIVRALGVYMHTGKRMSKMLKDTIPSDYNFIVITVEWPRKELYDRINLRVDRMFQAGLAEEAKNLYKNFGSDAPVFAGVGYKQLIPWLTGVGTLEEATEKVKKATRNYAKNQLTWWRHRDIIRLQGLKLSNLSGG